MRKGKIQLAGLLTVVLVAIALCINACGPGGIPTVDNNTTPTATPLPTTFKIYNEITGSGAAVTFLNIIAYSNGSQGESYNYYPSVASGASTVVNLDLPSTGYYYVYLYDSNGYDLWAPYAITLGNSYAVTLSNTTGTINTTNCNPCDIN